MRISFINIGFPLGKKTCLHNARSFYFHTFLFCSSGVMKGRPYLEQTDERMESEEVETESMYIASSEEFCWEKKQKNWMIPGGKYKI